MSNLLSNLLFDILLAAFLGGLIGWFWKKIVSQKRLWQQEEKLHNKLNGRDSYISQLKVELKEAEDGIELQHAALQKSLEKRGTDIQDQQIKAEQYLVRMQAAESKLMSLQRNYIIYKAQKQREVDQLQGSLKKVLPLRDLSGNKLTTLDANDSEIDMDSTLELNNEMRGEENPFVLRNALINEKRKVEHLSLVKKELGDTYFRFANEKQQWAHEKAALVARIRALEENRTKKQKYKSSIIKS